MKINVNHIVICLAELICESEKTHNNIENLLDSRRLRMLPLPSLSIHLLPRVTLTFDLLTPKVDGFMILAVLYGHTHQFFSRGIKRQ